MKKQLFTIQTKEDGPVEVPGYQIDDLFALTVTWRGEETDLAAKPHTLTHIPTGLCACPYDCTTIPEAKRAAAHVRTLLARRDAGEEISKPSDEEWLAILAAPPKQEISALDKLLKSPLWKGAKKIGQEERRFTMYGASPEHENFTVMYDGITARTFHYEDWLCDVYVRGSARLYVRISEVKKDVAEVK